ncbi:YitT family protein [Mycoplasmatota bacterium]|nr:YitT family protein [Mycoplasmatota bacterium]
MNKRVFEYVMITLGVTAMGFGFHFFNAPYNLVIGGVSGIGIIVKELFNLDPVLSILVLNILFLLLGLLVFGKGFFLKTIYGSLLFPLSIYLIDLLDKLYDVSPITNDVLLAVIFAALLIGIGLGIVLRFGGTTGGMDIPQKILHQYLKIPFSYVMYVVDGIIIVLGSIVFGLEIGLYSLLSMLLIGRFVDLVLIGGKNRKSVYIITNYPDEIKQSIYDSIRRGVSEVPIVGGFSKDKKTMLLCVVENREYYSIVTIINQIDKNAFVFVNNSSEVLGEGFYG